MNKVFKALVLSLLGLLATVSIAYAHVTVNPRNAEPGYGVAIIRVPNEKDNPTVAVKIIVPEGAVVHGVKAVPGWTYAASHAESPSNPTQKAGHGTGSGRITEISWTGGQIGAGEFEEFPLSVQYAGTGDFIWKAYQTYADGETVGWDGGTDSNHPASVVAVAEKAEATEKSQQVVPQNQWLSILAILIALAALFISLRKK